MKVVHFNRGARPGNYTFEQLFGNIRTELGKSIKIENFDLPFRKSYLNSILWARQRAGNINHITGDVNFLAYGLPADSTIITVHDIGHYSETLIGWKKIVYKKFWLENPLSKVRYITTISDFTKKELIEKIKVPEEKIIVIPNPVLPMFKYNPKIGKTKKPVILQVGSGHNKNLSRLISAIKGLDVKLLLINKLYDKSIKEQLVRNKIDFEQRTDLDAKALVNAYRESDLLFFASEYEGFGLPIIEAQAIGRPVITSNLASMPEVAGENGALFVNPFDTESIREAIEKLTLNEGLYCKLVEQGLENVKRFQIEKIIDEYLKLYYSIH